MYENLKYLRFIEGINCLKHSSISHPLFKDKYKMLQQQNSFYWEVVPWSMYVDVKTAKRT
jgi:hypothetical protein